MATLEKIRNRAGVLVSIVIGLALVAFILGDILGSGPSLFTDTQFEIAEIAGESVSYQNFQNKVDNISEMYMLNTGEQSLDSETYENIMEQAWQTLTREIILEQEYDRLGIQISPEELFDMVQGANIHPIVRQLFTDPETGTFNQAYVIQFLRSMQQDPTGQQRAYWMHIENEITKNRKESKYNSLISQGLYVPNFQAKQAWEENNKSVSFDFIVQRFNTVHDSLAQVSPSEIRRYYRQNREDFLQTASRDIEYIAFNVDPSDEDDRLAQEWIERMKEEFTEVEEVRQFINLNSDIPYDQTNYSYDELPENIADFMFAADPGDIYGPYFEDNSYKLSRLVEINFVPDSVRARHILIQPGPELDYQQAGSKADSLLGVLRRGGNFETLAIQYSDDTGSRFDGGNLGWFTEGMMVPEFDEACFTADQGEPFVVETQFGFHVAEVTGRSRELKKVRYATLAREVTPGSATYQRIYSKASHFAGMNTSYDEFTAAAREEDLTIRVANNILINDKQVPGIESARELVRWAFEAREESISPIFEIEDRFVIAALTKVRRDGYQPLEEASNEIESILKRKKKGEILVSRLQEKIADEADIASLAKALDTKIEQADNIRFTSFSVPGAGIEPRLIGTAMYLDENILSLPVVGENGVYTLQVRSVEIPDEMDLETERNRLKQSKRARVNFEVFEALKEEADIKDNRHKFF